MPMFCCQVIHMEAHRWKSVSLRQCILVGLPVGTWIAVRLGSSKRRVGVTALVISLFWSTLPYWVTLNGIEQLAG
jgi:hypothetical protein